MSGRQSVGDLGLDRDWITNTKNNQHIYIYFLPPLSHTFLLYMCFASQTALLGFYHDSSLFTSPMTSIHAGARENRHCVCVRERERERECTWWGTKEDRSTINFGHVPAACVPGECFIHCAMPLGLTTHILRKEESNI